MTQPAVEPRPQPAPPPGGRGLPEIPGPVETAVRFWRWLRRMSTALLLLFLLALASVLATLVPQAPLVPQTVARWQDGSAGPGAGVAAVLDWMGAFDVFGSIWFTALVVLLFTSLTGCLVPRWRAFLRALRRPPAAGKNLDRLRHSLVLETGAEPDAALEHAQQALSRFRLRRVDAAQTASGHPQLAAERGHAREGGSLVFHTAFFVLLIGVAVGGLFGFTGQINLVEGDAFADTRIAYDAVRPGRWFGVEDHRGFLVTLDDFDVAYHDNGVPAEFRSTVSITDPRRPGEVVEGDVRVNHPLSYDGMKLYQMRFGFAPRIIVRINGEVRFDEPVLLVPLPGQNLWTGTAKILVADPEHQLALDLVLAPDAKLDQDGRPEIGPSPEATNPVLVTEVYFGELGLSRPVPASDFDREGGPAGAPAMLRPGRSAALADGALEVEFAELAQWSGFQVSHAPGRWLLLLASGLVLGGLLPSLYGFRRRIWVEAAPRPDGGSTVRIAGVALHRKAIFSDEFDRLTARLADALPPRKPPAPTTDVPAQEASR